MNLQQNYLWADSLEKDCQLPKASNNLGLHTSTSQIRHNLLTRQQRKKAFYDRDTLNHFHHESEPVNEAGTRTDTCRGRGRQTTPGSPFLHSGHPGWNADTSKLFPSSADQGGGISSLVLALGSSGQWWVKSSYATKHRSWYRNARNGTTPQYYAGGTTARRSLHEDHHSVFLKLCRILSSYYKFKLREHLSDLVVVHIGALTGR